MLIFFINIYSYKRYKSGKISRIASVVMLLISVFILAFLLFNSFSVKIPEYIIMGSLGLIETYLTVIISFLKQGNFMCAAGCILFILGHIGLLINISKSEEV